MNAEQPQLSDPVLITVDLMVDRLWTERELLVHLLAHFSGLLREIPALLADNDTAAAAQHRTNPVTDRGVPPRRVSRPHFAAGRGMTI
jgi:hypothetical protein